MKTSRETRLGSGGNKDDYFLLNKKAREWYKLKPQSRKGFDHREEKAILKTSLSVLPLNCTVSRVRGKDHTCLKC